MLTCVQRFLFVCLEESVEAFHGSNLEVLDIVWRKFGKCLESLLVYMNIQRNIQILKRTYICGVNKGVFDQTLPLSHSPAEVTRTMTRSW